MIKPLQITEHDELTYERLIKSLPEPAQKRLREQAIKENRHVVHIIKDAILSFAGLYQHLRSAA